MKYSIADNNSTAVWIRKLRSEHGLSQQQLATRAGVSFSFVNQVERGKLTVRLDAINKILRVFGYAMAPTRVHSAPQLHEAKTAAQEPVLRQKNDWAFFK